jgi:hypothetical protein
VIDLFHRALGTSALPCILHFLCISPECLTSLRSPCVAQLADEYLQPDPTSERRVQFRSGEQVTSLRSLAQHIGHALKTMNVHVCDTTIETAIKEIYRRSGVLAFARVSPDHSVCPACAGFMTCVRKVH